MAGNVSEIAINTSWDSCGISECNKSERNQSWDSVSWDNGESNNTV